MSEHALARCPFCKGEDIYPLDTDFHDADGPLYWTVWCRGCKAHGPVVEMYGTEGWSDEQRKWLNMFRSEDVRMNALSMVNKQRAIEMWNAYLGTTMITEEERKITERVQDVDREKYVATLLEHSDIVAVKIWTKEDVEDRAMLYVADNTNLGEKNEKNALKKIDEIVEYILANPQLLKDKLSNCTGYEWDVIDNAVSIAAREVGL